MTDNILDKLEKIKNQKCMMLNCPVVKNNIEKDQKIINLRKENKELKETLKALRDELIGDRKEIMI